MADDNLGVKIRKRLEKWGEKLNAENAIPLFVVASNEKGKPILLADSCMTTEDVRDLVKVLASIIDQGVAEVVQ